MNTIPTETEQAVKWPTGCEQQGMVGSAAIGNAHTLPGAAMARRLPVAAGTTLRRGQEVPLLLAQCLEGPCAAPPVAAALPIQ